MLHLSGLAVPLVGRVLGLLLEELLVGHSVRSSQTVPERRVLAVVVVEVQVVHGVARRAVQDRAVGYVLAIVDQDGPDVDEGEERDVGEFLERKDEWEDVVWDALGEAVEWVEGVRCVRRWHDPFVVRLVETLVDHWMVQAAVDPVDAEVGEDEEEWQLQQVVPSVHSPPCALRNRIVHLGITANFGEEEGHRTYRHDGHGFHRLLNLHPDLVLEELWVFESGLIEDKDI